MSTVVPGGWPPSPANDPGIRKVVPASYIVYNDPYDQKYHAVADGSLGLPGTDIVNSDAATLINSALAVLTSGGQLFLKAGTYPIASGLVSSNSLVSIRGESKESVILSATAALSSDMLTLNGVGCTIQELTFDGNSSTAGSCITAGNSSNTTRLTIANCNIASPSASGINLRSQAGVCFVYGNRIQTFFSPNNKVSTGSGIAMTGNADGHIFHNDVGGFKSGAGIILNNTDDFEITGNQVYVNNRGIDNYLPSRARIIGNNVGNNNLTGIRCFADLAGTWKGTTIVGNTVRNNSQSSSNTQDGIQLATSGGNTISEIVVADNICDDTQGGATQRYGISVNDTGVQNTIIRNNVCLGNATAGMLLNAVGTGLVVSGNIGFNPQGVAAITVTASPFTYTNSDGVPEAIYINNVGGGTVSDISKNSISVSPTAPFTVWLEPTEAAVVTYSGTITMKKDRK